MPTSKTPYSPSLAELAGKGAVWAGGGTLLVHLAAVKWSGGSNPPVFEPFLTWLWGIFLVPASNILPILGLERWLAITAGSASIRLVEAMILVNAAVGAAFAILLFQMGLWQREHKIWTERHIKH